MGRTMSPLYSVIFASRCPSNHHRIAVDALRHLRTAQAGKWADVFLVHHQAYLKGAKTPDDTFKDFKNHVCHVRDGYWGGAPDAAEIWYVKTVEALAAKKWKDAAYNAGVLSHYVVDPIQPFHTGQTETGNVIHRAVEQSFSKSYGAFQQIIEASGGYGDVTLPRKGGGTDWVAQTVRVGADAANPFYEAVIDHYDFKRGAKKPPEGMDDALRNAIAPLVARAVVTFARVLDRAIEEAAVKPPFVIASLDAFFANMTAPIHKIAASMADGAEKSYVLKMYKEYEKTGRVAKTLPDDDREVRAQYAEEVLNVPVSKLDAEMPGPIGAAYGTPIGIGLEAALGVAPKAKPAPAAAPPKPPEAKTSEAKTSEAKASEPTAQPKPSEPVKASAEPAPKEKPARKRAAKAEPEAKAEPKPKAPRKSKAKEPAYDPDSPFAVLARANELVRSEEPHVDEAPAPAPPPGVRLHRDDHIVDAPAIGQKTAARFEAIGFKTVADLLEASPDEIAKSLRASHMTPPIIRDWQAQALLACTIPNVRSIDAQALVANGVRDAEALAKQDAKKLTAQMEAFHQTPNGRQLARNAKPPTLDVVKTWIDAAKRTPAQKSVAA